MKKIQLISSFSPRTYQETLFSKTLKKNSLIVLPTGLGKTIIALMHAVHQFNSTNKKILFLAPTKPLVQQHEKSFKEVIKNIDEITMQTLVGTISPDKRKELYNKADIIFSTPQIIENDLINKRIDPEIFSLLIVDEAHRATGNYAYCFIAEELSKTAQIIALTASPGTSKIEIKTIMSNLSIESIEVKRYEDDDVKPYVQDTQIEHITVELSNEQKKIKQLFDKVIEKKRSELQTLFKLKTTALKSKRDILEFQASLKKQIAKNPKNTLIWKGVSNAAALMKLYYGCELFDSQDFKASYTYFYDFFREGGDNSKAAKQLTLDNDFRKAFELLQELNKKEQRHPKLIKIKEIIRQELANNKDLKIILFNQYRETAHHLLGILEEIPSCSPVLFMGQAKKGGFSMSQKKQKQILDEFRDGVHNVLLSTSVGEEGLDIPKVDLVVFYEPVPSAIRTIQRIGRTGRFNKGKAYVLQTKDTRDIATRYVASSKEKSMYKAFDSIKNEKPQKESLTNFITKSETKQPKTTGVLVDNREHTDLIKQLYRNDSLEVEATQLEVGDIVVSEEIAIERKASLDFVNSILDKKIFSQLINLARNFKRPLLIIEGDESLYAQRNVNPAVIRASLISIAIDLRIPILYSSSIEETVEIIETIVKRNEKKKTPLSLISGKKGNSQTQELEKFISSIPKLNIITAKKLLQHFNTIENVVQANPEDFEKVEGVGSIRAKALHDFFRREYID